MPYKFKDRFYIPESPDAPPEGPAELPLSNLRVLDKIGVSAEALHPTDSFRASVHAACSSKHTANCVSAP